MTQAVAGRRILVVGASSGIGREVALEASARGAVVAFAARRDEMLRAAVKSAGGGVDVRLDVRDEESVARGVAEAADALGAFDAIVYAAGMSPLGTIADLTADDWRMLLETNVMGAALVARAAIPRMAEGGVLAFCSSVSVGRPRRGLVGYSSSKAALDELVRGIQAEHRSVRSLRVVIGDTMGTGFGEAFDPEALSDVLPHWIVEAHLYTRQMDAVDLARAIVDVLATAFDHPDIALSDVRFEPAGGLLTLPPTAEVLGAFTPPDR